MVIDVPHTRPCVGAVIILTCRRSGEFALPRGEGRLLSWRSADRDRRGCLTGSERAAAETPLTSGGGNAPESEMMIGRIFVSESLAFILRCATMMPSGSRDCRAPAAP